MIKLRNLIREGGGEGAGKMELVKTSLKKARQWVIDKGLDIDKELPEFNKSFMDAQSLAGLGKTKRAEMPVINDDDIKKFQAKLEQGEIDIYAPFAKETPKTNPFPTGLSDLAANQWLKNGLRDGQKKDDMVPVKITKETVGSLKPIQKQIYFDKSMGATIQNGIKGTADFLKHKTFFIVSSDNYIIDGHHRFLSGILVDPNMKVNCLSISLPISKLLPMSAAYGDAIGNKRNK